jgi:hypothetical protein
VTIARATVTTIDEGVTRSRPNVTLVDETATFVDTNVTFTLHSVTAVDHAVTLRQPAAQGGEYRDTTVDRNATLSNATSKRNGDRIIMTTAKNITPRAIASLKMPLPVSALLTYALGIVKGMSGNPAFPNPTPPLAEVTSAINALSAAETTALARTKGAVLTRNAERATLVTLLHTLKAYVQTTADASPDNGAAIITSAGMAVRKTAVRPPRSFQATVGAVSGSAKVVVPAAAHRACYDREYSTDGGKTWVPGPTTLTAKATITGLPAGTTVQFRYRAVTKLGEGDWSQPVSLLVK